MENTVSNILQELELLGNETTLKHQRKQGAHKNIFGVKMGDIRAIAKKLKTNHELALKLWITGNIDAQYLSILLFNPKKFNLEDLNSLIVSETFMPVLDWLYNYVIKDHAVAEKLRLRYMESHWGISASRIGWSLTAGRISRNLDGLNLTEILDRIERELGNVEPEIQWTMNAALAQLGIHFPEYRKRCIVIAEFWGVYRDYPVSKGCTSPYAPIWIQEMVSRKG